MRVYALNTKAGGSCAVAIGSVESAHARLAHHARREICIPARRVAGPHTATAAKLGQEAAACFDAVCKHRATQIIIDERLLLF